jgi:hypothetical protein
VQDDSVKTEATSLLGAGGGPTRRRTGTNFFFID